MGAILSLGLGGYYYWSMTTNHTAYPVIDLLGQKSPSDLLLLKNSTRPRYPGVMTDIIQEQSMTGKSTAAIRNPLGPPNSKERYVNAGEVVQKKGYQKDYQIKLRDTQVKFQTVNDHYNSFTQNHTPMEGIMKSIFNFSNSSGQGRQTNNRQNGSRVQT